MGCIGWFQWESTTKCRQVIGTKTQKCAPFAPPASESRPGSNDSETMYARQQSQLSDVYLQDVLQTAISNAIQSSSIIMDGFDPLPERKHDKKANAAHRRKLAETHTSRWDSPARRPDQRGTLVAIPPRSVGQWGGDHTTFGKHVH